MDVRRRRVDGAARGTIAVIRLMIGAILMWVNVFIPPGELLKEG